MFLFLSRFYNLAVAFAVAAERSIDTIIYTLMPALPETANRLGFTSDRWRCGGGWMSCVMPPDLYKEVILAFRKRSDDIVPSKIVEYLDRFPKRDRIERIIDEEVF